METHSRLTFVITYLALRVCLSKPVFSTTLIVLYLETEYVEIISERSS